MKKLFLLLALLLPLTTFAIPVSWNKNVAGKIFPPLITDYVGIGTSTPPTALTLAGDGARTGGISLWDGAGGNPWYWKNDGNRTSLEASGVDATGFRILSDVYNGQYNYNVQNGNIDLSGQTASSTSDLGWNITAGCFAINNVCVAGNDTINGFGFANMLTSWVDSNTITATSGPTASLFVATSSTATSSFAGRVGIGTTTPRSNKLSVGGGEVSFQDTNTATTTIGNYNTYLKIGKDTIAGILDLPIIDSRNSLGARSVGIPDALYLYDKGTDPSVTFIRSSTADTSSVSYETTNDLISFTNASGGYSFNDGTIGVNVSPVSTTKITAKGSTVDNTAFVSKFLDSDDAEIFTVRNDGIGYISSRFGVATSAPGTSLSIGNTGDNTININPAGVSTFGNGIDLRSGCFSVLGVCVENFFSSASGANDQVAVWGPLNGLEGSNDLFFENTNDQLGIGTSTFPSNEVKLLIDGNSGGGTGNVQAQIYTQTIGKTAQYSMNRGGAFSYFGPSTADVFDILTTESIPILLSTAGTGQMIITAGGLIGIASGTPQAKLTVTNTLSGSSLIVEDQASPDPTPFVIDAAGLVGVGTTTPGFLLDVFSTGTTTARIDSNSTTKGSCLVMKDIDGVGYTYVTANNGALSASTVPCN